MSEAAPRADEMSGTNVKTLPAWMDPNTVACSMVSHVKLMSIPTYHESNEKLFRGELLE